MKFSYGKTLIGLGFIALVVLVYQVGTKDTAIANVEKETELVSNPVRLATSTLSLKVSGIVKASDRAVISAKTSGIVTDFLVKEGSYVYPNQVLVRQDTPVVDAELALRAAEADLTRAEQIATVDSVATDSNKATVVADSAKEMAELSSVSSDHRVSEATAALLVSTQSGVNVLIEALQFVDTNRGLFRGEDLDSYNELVNDLYGSIPKHFQGGLMYPINSSEDVLQLLEVLINNDEVDPTTALNLGVLVDTDLQALRNIYTGAETDVLNESLVDPNSAIYEQYFAYRTAIVEALSALTTSVAAVQSATDTALGNAVTQDQSVTVSTISAESAERQATFSVEIAKAARKVANTASGVTLAKQQLGVVTAPFSGVVVKRFKEVGEYAALGEPLLQVSGTGGAEVSVNVPTLFAESLRVGAPFRVDGQVVGVVDRFSPVSDGNSTVAVISLKDGSSQIGQSIVGEIELVSPTNVYQIPRSYVHFASADAYLVDENDDKYPVEIVYDSGDVLYVSTDMFTVETLKPAYSLFLSS